MVDVIQKAKRDRLKTKERSKEKIYKCPYCPKNDLKGIRSLSQHIHAVHDGKNELAQQKAIAYTVFGSALVSKWLQMMIDKTAAADYLKNVIPPAVKKYYYILKKYGKIKSQNDDLQKKDTPTKTKEIKPIEKTLIRLTINSVINKLKESDPKLLVCVYDATTDTWRFILDMMYDITPSDDSKHFIFLKTRKKLYNPNKSLHVEEAIKFLENEKIPRNTPIHFNRNSSLTHEYLVKLETIDNAIVFKFERDDD